MEIEYKDAPPQNQHSPIHQAPIPTLRRLCIAIGVLGFLGFVFDIVQAANATHVPYKDDNSNDSSSGTAFAFAALFITDLWAILQYGIKLRRLHRPLLTQKRDMQIFFRGFFMAVSLIVPCMQISVFQEEMRQTSRILGYNDADLFFCHFPSDYERESQAQRDEVKFVYDSPYSDDARGACAIIRTRFLMGWCIILLALVEVVLYARSNIGTEAWVERNIEILFDNAENRQQSMSEDGSFVEGEWPTLSAKEEKEMAQRVFYLK